MSDEAEQLRTRFAAVGAALVPCIALISNCSRDKASSIVCAVTNVLFKCMRARGWMGGWMVEV